MSTSSRLGRLPLPQRNAHRGGAPAPSRFCQRLGRRPALRGAHADGFTLIELVVSLTILAIMLTVTYGMLSGLLHTKKLLDDRRDLRAITNTILVRLTHELQQASPERALIPPQDRINQPYPANTNLIGERQVLDNDQRGDRLTFLAKSAGQYQGFVPSNSGLVQISYRVEPDPEREDHEPLRYVLVRDEIPYQRPFEDAYRRILTFDITRRLVGLQLRYLDGESREWRESWGDNNERGLPAAIEFTISVLSPSGVYERITSSVPLRAQDEER